ncbi:MAG TPA: flagellar basal body L-ring protein FlgH [Thermoguttaceae bacterium]|nr:flagellar basal body L-ring protein FlgH [Thermoguttaceae bacterium]
MGILEGGVLTSKALGQGGGLSAPPAPQQVPRSPFEGPSGSLFGPPGYRTPLMRDAVDFGHVPTPQPRTLKLNDIVIVNVDEKSHVLSEGEMDRRKNASLKAELKDWIIFSPRSFGIRPDPQSAGEPKIDSQWDNKYRAQADFEARDAMKFTIAARVVDIRPNGSLVIEGRRIIQHNEDSWEYFLLGVIRPEDIKPNNTVESEKIAELRLWKRESGHVRDGYRRGWLMEWLDRFQPF